METAIQYYNDIIHYFKANYINIVFILLFVVGGFVISNFIKRRIKVRLVRKSPNHITASFISQIVGFILKSIIVFTTLYLLGLSAFTNKLLAGAGLLTFVIGFALKDIGENFLAGIILAFKSPFRLDDLIEVNGITGHVKDISIRETLVKTPDGKDVFLPNAIILKNPLYNYTLDGFLRYEFTVGIAYENNPTEAINLIFETVNNVEGILKGDRTPVITITELATNAINIEVKFWVDTFKSTKRSVHMSVRSRVMNDVVEALIKKGYSLPATILELKNYEPYGNLKLNVEKKLEGSDLHDVAPQDS
ncbi:mechanosensitive ion channel family protein [Arenibacter sp. GZD96]|uniref:mechanosensitive ion channel family protein n=1 Tax=Aurantibrevibacter litoralis TaxID=3106030 RepID=UPI002AFF01A4|nr:mechanosensitive ion channel family protein [Arenibacter sp. GZD-96]MEA1785747.1 mechanosensitive ion channel family protein [Arenibacter sp. GZD-96]